MNALILSCSERPDNLTLRFARFVSEYFPEAELVELSELHLNLMGHADDSSQANLETLKSKFAAAAQVVFLSPEYNWGLAPNAKNLIDYLSGDTAIWTGKVFMCFGCSAGRGGRLPILDMWRILNKVISFNGAISVVSPYHLELNSLVLDEAGEIDDGFREVAARTFANHAKLAGRFLGQ
jgi:NAD(P)H-dependent FMN reductase